MIIKDLQIRHFGKLNNTHIPLSRGLNIITGKNESGKSTISAYIEAMLFGMVGARKSIQYNTRSKYMPWGESKAEGQLTISYGNEEIAIQRSFGAKKSDDRIQITRTATGELINAINQNMPAKSILGISVETFRKTAFIKQLAAGISQTDNDEIITMLMNMSETGDADVSYNQAKEVLKNYKKQIVNSEKKPGVLDKEKSIYNYYYQNLQRLQFENKEIKQAIENGPIDTQGAYEHMYKQEMIFGEECLEEIKENMSQLALLNKMIKEQDIDQKQKNSIPKKEYITNEIAEDYIKYKEYRLSSEGYVSKLKVAEEHYSQLKRLQQQKKLVLEEYPDIDIFDFELESVARDCIEKLESVKQYEDAQVKKLPLPVTVMAGAFIGVIGIVLGFIVSQYFFFGLIVFPITVFQSKSKHENRNEKESEVNHDSKRNKDLEKLQSLLPVFTDKNLIEIKETYVAYKKVREKYVQIELLLNEKKSQCKIVDIQKYKESYKNEISNIKYLMDKYNAETYEALEETLTNGMQMSTEENIRIASQKITKQSEESIIDQIKQIKSKVTEQILMAYENATTRTRLNCEVAKEKIVKLNKELEAVELAIQSLDEVFAKFHASFGKKINSRAAAILEEISNGKYKELFISKTFDVKLRNDEDGYIYHVDYFSNGTWDQVYLALRLSIIECFQDNYNMKMPIILDDIFVQYDDERIKNALNYLYKYSENQQIILLTCQSREREMLKDNEHINWICLD